jgi:type-F conjugative transfer system pilin assembly protein TrbC
MMKKYKKTMQNKVTRKINKMTFEPLGCRWLIVLIGAIIFTFLATMMKVFAVENKQIRVGKEILAEIKNNQKQNTDIKIKDFQQPLDNDMANWSFHLEKKLNTDAKNTKPRVEPELKATQEQQELAKELLEKSHDIMNRSLGIPQVNNNIYGDLSYTDFLIFASFSMGEKNLENLIQLAASYNGAVILRGLKNGSFKETAAFLSKFFSEHEGILIEPDLFLEYEVTKVPTFVLTKPCEEGLQVNCKTVYDKLTGMVSPRYALQKFSEKGELKEFAKERLGR